MDIIWKCSDLAPYFKISEKASPKVTNTTWGLFITKNLQWDQYNFINKSSYVPEHNNKNFFSQFIYYLPISPLLLWIITTKNLYNLLGILLKCSIFSIILNYNYNSETYYYYLVDKETEAWKLKPKELCSRSCYFFRAQESGIIPALAWLQSHGINQHIASFSLNESASESSFDESDCWSSTSQ